MGGLGVYTVMAEDTTIEEAIETVAEGPAKATIDGDSVEQQKIEDLIKADKYLRGKEASRATGLGLKILGLRPGNSL